MTQTGYGVGGIFRGKNVSAVGNVLKPVLGEIGKIGVEVGGELLKNMVAGVIDGKSVKDAARESGKQAAIQSVDLAGKRTIKAIKEKDKPAKRAKVEKKKPKKKTKNSQKGGGFFIEGRKAREPSWSDLDPMFQFGGKKRKGVRRNGKGVFPRSKQRKPLPAKDIFG
jgi:ribosomal protein L12E/L44/L45/RPP1/RPP2